MKPEKVIRDGKVAVLFSPGFGAGWSTWADAEVREFITFDRHFVEAAEAGKSPDDIERLAKTFGIEYLYTGGWSDIKIVWLTVGTPFEIHEYDGSESIRVRDEQDWMVA